MTVARTSASIPKVSGMENSSSLSQNKRRRVPAEVYAVDGISHSKSSIV